MKEQDLLDIANRKKIIAQIKSNENVQRKVVSYKKQNMQEDNFHQYVVEFLRSKLDKETVAELSIFSNINLQRRVSKSEASIYKKPPVRTVKLDGKDLMEFESIYSRMGMNTCLRVANEAYKYQGQCAIQIYPEYGELRARVLQPHHFDVIPDEKNPEIAIAYIISNFDNTSRDRMQREDGRTGNSQGDKTRDGVNADISDYDDQIRNAKNERYYVWSKLYNFVMNGNGVILDKETESIEIQTVEDSDPNIMSPLAEYECIPFIDVSSGKNFEFWVRGWDSLYDATIMYNVILTSEFQVVEMQGHAQPYYKGDVNHMPKNIRVGVDKMIFIPLDPNNNVQAEFGFANPGSDLSGIRDFRESFLSAFLSSRGLDTGIVSGKAQANTATSGVERLLQMVEKFEASQEDISLFENVEEKLVHIVSCFSAALSNQGEEEGGLNENYEIKSLPENPHKISLNLQYDKPEMIKTEMEKLEVAEKKLEMGLTSKVHILMNLENMTEEEAVKHLEHVARHENTERV